MRQITTMVFMLAGLVLILAVAASAGSSANYRLDHVVVNAFGSTAAASQSILYSGGETVIGQTYSNTYSAQVGFLNEYFQPMPTPTPTPTAVITLPASIPPEFFKIYNSQINPTHGEQASIKWCQPAAGPVTITIYNLLGDKVVTLVDHQSYAEGQYHEAPWKGISQGGSMVGSGIYIVRLKAGAYERRGRIAVIK